jgi:putative transposase
MYKEGIMNDKKPEELYYRRLPHVQPESGLVFITFRLNQDLPKEIKQELDEYKKKLLSQNTRGKYRQNKIRKLIFGFYDNQISTYASSDDFLSDPEIAKMIFDLIKEFDGVFYKLYCFTIMPNHVHLLFRILMRHDDKPHEMAFIIKKLKAISARNANKILNREGKFWFREYYDYSVRTEKELVRIIEYISQNPVKAGLVTEVCQWKWTWIAELEHV